jgi:membrane-bound lytic murein transglycosylase A
MGWIVLAALAASCSPVPMQKSESGIAAAPATRSATADSAKACAPAAPCAACPVCQLPKPVPEEAAYKETPWTEVPSWGQTPFLPSLKAFIEGCSQSQSKPPWQKACTAARKSVSNEHAARTFFESIFAAYRIVAPDGREEGLVTGYYEPILKGRRQKGAGFPHPVYAVPDDLIVVDLAELHPELRGMRLRGRLQGRRLVPYYSRSEIEAAAPAFPARPLAWVADPVELFFLQIQGSGQIELPSGERYRLGFADQNGHPYRSLGRYLIDRGELKVDQASMQAIKSWAASRPQMLQDALNANPSYVFFRELPPPRSALDGPLGALGVPLTPGYSIAVDPGHIPLGAPVFLQTTQPLSTVPLNRLVMAQDTGGAIRGAIRADFFWGTGEEAGNQAGRMRQLGRMWLLWPKGEALPRQP